ncbi:MAG: hypothetical protein WC587_01105 [Candidatus Paceibacterota bacterium]
MRKLLVFLVFLVVLFYLDNVEAAEKKYCELSNNPYTLKSGEIEYSLTEDTFLPNKRDGKDKTYFCWLRRGELVVADETTGRITRIKKCSNPVVGEAYVSLRKEVLVEALVKAFEAASLSTPTPQPPQPTTTPEFVVIYYYDPRLAAPAQNQSVFVEGNSGGYYGGGGGYGGGYNKTKVKNYYNNYYNTPPPPPPSPPPSGKPGPNPPAHR